MDYKNILIVKLSAIGDVIHALPVASALKRCNPGARITWVVEKPAYDLLTNNPDIDEIIIFEKAKFKSLTGLFANAPQFSRMLKDRSFDLCIDLQGLFKSAAISFLSGAPRKIGYCNMRELSDWVSPPTCGPHDDGHVIDRYLDVDRALGCQITNVTFPIIITEEEKKNAEEIAAACGLDNSRLYVVLAPGTNWPTKCWPADKFAELASLLNADDIPSVVIGGPGDRPLADRIASATKGPIIDLTGKTTLKQLAYIIQKGSAFVGGDTGPMHLAVAVGTPVIALFGPTDPERNGPYHGSNNVITASVDCIKCWKRRCPSGRSCMDSIDAKQVHLILESYLHK